MKAMRRCERISRLVSEGMDRRLSIWERVSVRAHLLVCGACRRFRQQVRRLGESLASMGDSATQPSTNEQLSAEGRQRIAQAIDDAARR